ncbi:hypothetical protein [Gryllotalpicola koreensis]|uniref:DNA modification methylase n=1 Tax=Gryllotalpicola koreensis TaxID=993086 RepID=A0ABP8A3V6_9MICO
MKVRVAASVVLAVGVALATAGCGFITPQGTQRITQSTSFGVEGDVGDVHIRNAYLVSQDGKATLIATFVNKGDSGETLTIQPNASASDTKSLDVAEGDPTIIGPKQTLQWDDLTAKPGSLLPVFFTYGDKTGVTMDLPVLTGDFKVNSTLTPTPVPTATETPTATPTPTETATAG